MTRSLVTALRAGGPLAAAVLAAALGCFGTSGALFGLQVVIWRSLRPHREGAR